MNLEFGYVINLIHDLFLHELMKIIDTLMYIISISNLLIKFHVKHFENCVLI